MNEIELKEILENIGFTKSETSTYLALLDLGTSTTGPIIKKAKIPQGKIYVILDKLLNKGIITHTIKSGIKHFQAKDPQTLLSWFEELEKNIQNKKNKLLEILPELRLKYESTEYEKQVEIYEGFSGLKILYSLILEKGKTIQIIGSTTSTPEQLETYLINWHKERIDKKIDLKLIYSKERKKYAKNREKMNHTQVKYLNLPFSPSWTTIMEDYVITVTMTDMKNISCFLIKDKNVAKAQRDYFEIMWKQAK
jgi:HTH-type transcriptional regulator, sugar sensing transcriptional regulator